MSKNDEGCALLGIGAILLINLVWWSFVGWVIYMLVEWLTSK